MRKIKRFYLPKLILDPSVRIMNLNYKDLKFNCQLPAVLDPKYHFLGLVYLY